MKRILIILLLLPSILFAQRKAELELRLIPSIGHISFIPNYSKNNNLDLALHLILKDNSNNFYNPHTFNYIGVEINKTIKRTKIGESVEYYVPELLVIDVFLSSQIGFGTGFGFISEIQDNGFFTGNYRSTSITKMFNYIHHILSIEVVSEAGIMGISLIYSFSNKFKFKKTNEKLSFKGFSMGFNLGLFL